MDSVELPESPAFIPNGIERSHLTRLLDRAQPEPAAELRWRFALVEIATDTLQTIYASNKLPHAALWHEEARHRAGHFLGLALAGTFGPPPAQVQNNF